jgi:hypothetical protein
MTNVTIMATRPEHNLPLYKAANKAPFYSPPAPTREIVLGYSGAHYVSVCGPSCSGSDVSINPFPSLSLSTY